MTGGRGIPEAGGRDGTVTAVTTKKPNYHLTADERLVIDTRPHWVLLIPEAAKTLAGFLLWSYLGAKTGGTLGRVIDYALGAANLWFAVRFLVVLTRWWFTHFVITSERIIVRSGVVARKGIEIPLDRVNTVFFEQNILERIIKAGDVSIESASEQGRQTFFDVKNPQRIQQTIYEAREEARDGIERRNAALHGQAVVDAVRGSGVAEELERLAELHRSGSLSDEEYQRLKQRLIG